MRYGLANGRRIGEHLCRERPPDINLNVNSNVTFWPFMYTCMYCVNEAAPIYLWAGIVAYFGSSDARTFLHNTYNNNTNNYCYFLVLLSLLLSFVFLFLGLRLLVSAPHAHIIVTCYNRCQTNKNLLHLKLKDKIQINKII